MPIRFTYVEGEIHHSFLYEGEYEFRIGRSPKCEVVLQETRGSRYHASIVREDDRYFVVDKDSRNGTYLNGLKISRSELHEGDKITVGRAAITIDSLESIVTSSGDEEKNNAPEEPSAESASTGDLPPVYKTRSSQTASPHAVLVMFLLAGLIGLVLVFNSDSEPDTDNAKVASPAARSPSTPAKPKLQKALPENTDIEESSIAQLIQPRQPAAGESPETSEPTGTTEVDIEALDKPATLLRALLRDASHADSKKGLLEDLRGFVRMFPDNDVTQHAEYVISIIESERALARSERESQLLDIVETLRTDNRLGDAARFVRILAENSEGEDKTRWKRKLVEVETTALENFRIVEAQIDDFVTQKKPLEAFTALIAARSRYEGARFFDVTLNDTISGLLSKGNVQPTSKVSASRLPLKSRASLAFEECRFAEIPSMYVAMLTRDVSTEDRLHALEWIVKGSYMATMFEDFIERASRVDLEVSPMEGFEGRVIGVDARGVNFEIDFGERRGAYSDRLDWARVSYHQKARLFESIALSTDGTIGVALFCFHLGYDTGAHRALVRLHKKKEARDLANAILAWQTGEEVPEGGFVEYRSRLVSTTFRDTELARIKEVKAREEAARAELRQLKKSAEVGRYLVLALKQRQEGSFQLAQTILTTLSRRFPSTETGRQARKLIEDPVLAVYPLLKNGASANRLDLHVLGEGYPVDDHSQKAFAVSANIAVNLLFKHEPFREYESFFNVHAVHLESGDSGVDRNPGGVERNTALDGKVEWDTFTVNRLETKRLLKRAAPESSDGQIIVIGNDHAGVSTGGNGVSCVSKTALPSLAHEMGHSLAGLHDEYDYQPGTDPGRKPPENVPNVSTKGMPPNLMRGSVREDVLARAIWRKWIDTKQTRVWNGMGVAAFKGGNRTPFNHWRPQANCKMRNSSAAFCVVCMETMLRRIYQHAKPIDAVQPAQDEITIHLFESVEVRAWILKPRTHHLEAQWSLHRLPSRGTEPTRVVREPKKVPLRRTQRHLLEDGRMLEVASLRAREIESGRYRLSLKVSDPTPWLLESDRHSLAQTREWIVHVLPGSRPDEEE